MRAIIIEDEQLSVRHLRDLLRRHSPQVHVVATADSVESAVALLQSGPAPDVLFLDIHLSDGLSFELFEQLDVRCPVIFTTAYDAYALRAFKVNSIDYLLKPVAEGELRAALAKLQLLRHGSGPTPVLDTTLLAQVVQQLQRVAPYKQQFVVKVGEYLKVVPVDTIRYFSSTGGTTFLHTHENRHYVIDHTLEQLEQLVDPHEFFRLNRAFLVHQQAIQEIVQYSNSRLKTVLAPLPTEGHVLVSRDRVPAFRAWLER
ncbi:MAG TPA: LytTR family DNA-binding domain-containing protein [Hymenobacter sp.]|jgi:DNA-binding LytR/AlgR family response regulator|uniref:LytR/AlgR family response regulator transcription factor n=1 Tax=Hymenobacter sp. TaxID=1898978 RepID=UPI002EDB18F2